MLTPVHIRTESTSCPVVFGLVSSVAAFLSGIVLSMDYVQKGIEVLARAGIAVNGSKPWDIHIHNPDTFKRAFRGGSVAIGESYMDGWWDVEDLATFFEKVHRAGLEKVFTRAGVLLFALRARLFNLQSITRAWQVGEVHYDIGNDLYEHMLDKRMVYSCGYWKHARTLDEAQEAKLDLICKKIGLKPGDRILDIGCGWGSFLQFAAERYGVRGVGLTISKQQAALARERVAGLPIDILEQDYRLYESEPFDHIVSIGMFEHVGPKNYRTFMKKVRDLLKDDGLFLLHTIGASRTTHMADPWIDKYIFPNGRLPSVAHIGAAIDGIFQLEDWHNFGYDYATTLDAWHERFNGAWPDLRETYDERFRRMWSLYLASMSGSFRARIMHLWQIVLSKRGMQGGYESIR